jgi:predicted DNA-binding transcriptional regulator YafY
MEKRKHLPRAVLSRVYFIDREIASGKYPNTKQLAQAYETGTATICRDIEFMRDSLGAPIEYSALHRGFFYAEKTFRLPARFASADDMLALGIVKNLLSIYKETPLYHSVQNLLEDITAPLTKNDKPSAGSTQWYEDRVIVPPVASYHIDGEIWDIITTGLRENRMIAFDYQSVWNAPYQKRLVRPWQLLFDNGVWYLYAWSEERKAPRMFSLSRIKNIGLSDSCFTLPKDFDFRQRNDGSFFGVYSGEQKYHFRVAFYGDFVLWAKERTWAADQSAHDTENGVIIDFTSTQYGKVLEWVLSKGADAEPLHPPELVKDWQEHIKKWLYSKGGGKVQKTR